MAKIKLYHPVDASIRSARFRRISRAWMLLSLAFWANIGVAFAQLAITEVMSNASTSLQGYQRPDFWELTNFGTNEVDLDGYRWMDGDDHPFELRVPFPSTTIRSGESIVFVRDSFLVSDPEAFREWWGSSLPSDLQIHFQYLPPKPGFDADGGDAVRLWDKETNLVDEVRFGPARMGAALTYDPSSGQFSEPSQPNAGGAFGSALGHDVGSPGRAWLGPVPVRIVQEPVNQTVDAGSDVVLHAEATGRPAPRFQWFFNGEPIAIGVVTSSVPRLACYAGCGPGWKTTPGPNDLIIPTIQPHKGGSYFVEVFNGLTRTTSAVINITVNTNPSPIRVVCPLNPLCDPESGSDSIATLAANPGQDAIFTVRTRGYPPPAFQWSASANGVTFTNLPGATNQDLTLEKVTSADAGHYRVRLSNSSGETNALARLTVQPQPQLEVTEVMALACIAPNRDWWELTNTGQEPVNLCGFRWDDFDPAIGGGPTITNHIIIPPGESVIFLESQTTESFAAWWGASNLPPNVQFITYSANGLSDQDSDVICIWPPNETDKYRWSARVEFSPPASGFSRWWDLSGCPETLEFEFGVESTAGQCGSFGAEQGCDIGSPGWTRWTPPALTSIRREGSRCILAWKAQPGSVNRLQFARRLAVPIEATVWEDLGDAIRFPGASGAAIDSTIGSEPQRFYRIARVATADCPCPP